MAIDSPNLVDVVESPKDIAEASNLVLPDEDAKPPQKWKKRIRRSLFALLLLSVLGVGGYVAYSQLVLPQQQAGQRTKTISVKRMDLPVTISANGTIKPERSINVSPKTSGVLKRLLVKEGDSVQQGQTLAYMDDSNLQGQFTQAQGQLASAEANLQRLKAGNRPEDIAQAQARLKSAQATLSQAEDNLRRYQGYFNEGGISRQNLIQYQTARDTAKAQVMESQQALALSQAGSRQEDIAQAEAQVESAQGSLQSIQAQLNDTVLLAPFSGVVTKKYADPGAFVTPTTAGSAVSSATSSSILSLASVNQVVANIPENSIAKVRLGQEVAIKVDAYPDHRFTGRVIQIAAQATVEQNVTSFEVKVAITDPKNLLRSGMNASVDFKVGQLENVLVVPTVAVVRQQNATGVFVAGKDNQPKFVPITTGATVNRYTEVKSGLQGDENVLISFPPGARPESTRSVFPGVGGGSSRGSQSGGSSGGSSAGGSRSR